MKSKSVVMKKHQQMKKRYEPKPVPAYSGVFSDSPLNTTTRVKVRRWHSYHGIPTLFLIVDENGRELCSRFAYEPDALAHCEALELGAMMEWAIEAVEIESDSRTTNKATEESTT
jgi:hypothetical protein